MVPVVDSSLLTQNPQFVFFSPRWYATFSLPFLLVVALILARVVVAVVSVFARVCCLSLFAILRCKTYRFIFNYSHHVAFSVGLSTTFNSGGTSSRSGSICSQGYVMDCFFAIQRSFLSQKRCFQ